MAGISPRAAGVESDGRTLGCFEDADRANRFWPSWQVGTSRQRGGGHFPFSTGAKRGEERTSIVSVVKSLSQDCESF